MKDKYIRALRRLALDRALTPLVAERLLNARDGGPGSGNHGHSGRPGKVGGSAPTGTNGAASGNAGRAKNGTVYQGKDFTLSSRGMRTVRRVWNKIKNKYEWTGEGRKWTSKGTTSPELPKGSGTTKISETDVGYGLHTINKFLTEDGGLTPERAALHDRIIHDMFKGKKPRKPGEPRTLYFLGGGSASGKSSFTDPEKCKRYNMPSRDEVTVVDADQLKKKLPEFDDDSDTGTTDRNKAANFAHEESSALSKRALEAAYANGYDVTLDGTGDSGVASVKKKIDQARAAGYRVEGRYCTADIEEALRRNRKRAIEEKRLVDDGSVIRIHKNVSEIVPQIAGEFDHFELWDHDGPEPRLVATCERGQDIRDHIVNKELWDKFLAKATWEPPKKKKS